MTPKIVLIVLKYSLNVSMLSFHTLNNDLPKLIFLSMLLWENCTINPGDRCCVSWTGYRGCCKNISGLCSECLESFLMAENEGCGKNRNMLWHVTVSVQQRIRQCHMVEDASSNWFTKRQWCCTSGYQEKERYWKKQQSMQSVLLVMQKRL